MRDTDEIEMQVFSGIAKRLTNNPSAKIKSALKENKKPELSDILLKICTVDSSATAYFGQIETSDIINYLIEEKKVTPTTEMLDAAITAVNVDVVKALVKNGNPYNYRKDRLESVIKANPEKTLELMEIRDLLEAVNIEKKKQLMIDLSKNQAESCSYVGGNTLLHEAVLYGESALVAKLLKEHPNLAKEKNLAGQTPLHIAIMKYNSIGSIESRSIESIVLNYLDTLDKKHQDKKTNILAKFREIIEYFTTKKTIDLNARDEHQKTPLDYLDKAKNKDIYNRLHKAGARTSKELDRSWSERLSFSKNDEETIEILQSKKPWSLKPSSTKPEKQTHDLKAISELNVAVKALNVDTVRTIVKNNGLSSLSDPFDQWREILVKNPEKTLKLMEIRDLLDRNKEEHSKLIEALSRDYKNKVGKLGSVTSYMYFSNSILHEAVLYGKNELVENLIKDYPTLANEQNLAGQTPLHIAIMQYNSINDVQNQSDEFSAASRSIESIVPNYLDTLDENLQNQKTNILAKFREIIEYFTTKKTIDLNARDRHQKTPLDYLDKEENEAMYNRLHKAGARTSKELDRSWGEYLGFSKTDQETIKNIQQSKKSWGITGSIKRLLNTYSKSNREKNSNDRSPN